MIDWKGLERQKVIDKVSIWLKANAMKHIRCITWAYLVCSSIRLFD
jgi:hypothetical protein